ncbi:MAG: ISAs1 family transposase [Oscillibacter sp.]|nr:ISAs1 family transposase [Oscillibacter sp.]
MAAAQVVRNGNVTTDTRYFIFSITDMETFAYAVRRHWFLENQLHWCLDVIFQKDSSRARSDMSPLNQNVLRKVALTLCRNADLGKRVGIQKKRFLSVLFGKS